MRSTEVRIHFHHVSGLSGFVERFHGADERIRRRLHEAFAREARGEVDPDLCIALGAAIQGGAIAGAEVSAVLVDVTPYTFGTSALGELNGEF